MYSSSTFGRIFWVDDDYEFKSCPLNVDGTGDFTCEDYISEWCDWEGVDMNELLAIHKTCILNKTQYGGSLSLNDYAHKITDRKDIVVDTFTNDYAEKVDTLVDKMGMTKYNFDENLYNEIVIDSKFSYGKFNDIDYPIHLSQS